MIAMVHQHHLLMIQKRIAMKTKSSFLNLVVQLQELSRRVGRCSGYQKGRPLSRSRPLGPQKNQNKLSSEVYFGLNFTN